MLRIIYVKVPLGGGIHVTGREAREKIDKQLKKAELDIFF